MKVLVNLPDELYDTLRSKTLYLTSGARSNGKHLVCELIGCVMNGVVIKDKIADIEALQPRIIDAVHGTICTFFEPVPDDSEAPMTPFDSRLLTVNKAVCNRIREIFESYSRKEQE